MEATLDQRAIDADGCRRLAQALRLDAVGVLRRNGAQRTLSWWTAPGAPALPREVEPILEGHGDGWIVAPAGNDVVIGRLGPGSSAMSVTAIRALLAGGPMLATAGDGAIEPDPLERERARWAYAIHDGLTQIVTATILDLEWRARQAAEDASSVPQVLSEAAAELRTALEEIRSILAVLTPEPETREAAPLDEVVRRVADRWHVPASWSVDGDLERVPASLIDAATSIISEGVANAAKHASARRVAVHVTARPTEMEVSVEDSGRGFRPQDRPAGAGHLGLAMMRRRVEELHGTLDIESEPGRGTRVVARLPVEEGDTP